MNNKKPPQRGRSASEQLVRVGHLEQRLDALVREIGLRQQAVLTTWYRQSFEPRFQAVERLWWNRFGLWVIRTWRSLKRATVQKFYDLRYRLFGKYPPLPEGAVVLYRVDDPVETTELGEKHFDGERQVGVVKKLQDGKVGVQIEGQDELMWTSPSVWKRLGAEAED
jgi:hypothetical protein